MPALNELQRKLGGADVQVVGISCDTTYALKDWAQHLGGLDFPPQRCQRGATETTEDVGVAPLPLDPAGTQLAADEPVVTLDRRQELLDVLDGEPVSCRRLGRRERAAGACEAHQHRLERVRDGLEERIRQPAGRHHTEGVARNVIGYIEGSDPVLKNEVIIVGGHLDHVGKNHLLMPGANDNASGVAVALGTAEALSKVSPGLRRSVLILLFGADLASC